MLPRIPLQLVCLVIVCLACQSEGRIAETLEPEGVQASASVEPLTPAEHKRTAAAMRLFCSPSTAPHPPHKSDGTSIEIEYQNSVRLSSAELAQLLTVAGQAGLVSPLKIRVTAMWLQGGADVQLLASVAEDPGTMIRTEEWLMLSRKGRPVDKASVQRLVDGGWEVEASPWMTSKTSYFRDGDALWEFDLVPPLRFERAIEIVRALGESQDALKPGQPLPQFDGSEFRPGYLGRIEARESALGRGVRFNDELDPNQEWDVLLVRNTGPRAGYALLLAEHEDQWAIVHAEFW